MDTRRVVDIDRKIRLIQDSTRTLFRVFLPVHDWLRMHSVRYYLWSLKSYSHTVHWAALFLFICALPAVFYSAFQSPQSPRASLDFAPESAEKNIDYSKIYTSLAKDAKEIPEKRTANAKAFRNPDGTIQYIISSGILHYKSGDKWLNINSNIEPNADGTGFVMNKSIYSASFGKNFLTDPLVSISKDGQNLAIRPKELSFSTASDNQLISSGNSSDGVVNEKDLTYKDAYGPGLDFGYETEDLRLNKKLTIPSFESLPAPTIGAEDKSDLSIKLNLDYTIEAGLDLSINDQPWDGTETTIENQNLVFKKDGKIAWQLTPAKAWDNQGQDKGVTGKTTISKVDNKIFVAITFPYTWLQTAQYPVTIDPATVYANADDGYIEGGNPTYATARTTSSLSDDTATTFNVGQSLVSIPYTVDRGFLRFDTSGLDDTATVSQTNLHLTATGDSSATDFDIDIFKTDWTSTLSANRAANYTAALGATKDVTLTNTNGMSLNTDMASPNLDTTRIIRNGYSYFILKSSRDTSSSTPTGLEYVQLASQDNATASYRPYLSVIVTTNDYTWDAGGDGVSWSDANNWDKKSGYPSTNADKAIINTGSAAIATPAGALTVGEINIGASYSGTVTLGNNLTITNTGGATGSLTIANASAVLNINGKTVSIDSTVSNIGTIKMTGDETVTLTAGNDTDSGTIEYSATSGSRDIKGWTYYSLKINGSGGTFTLPGATTANGDINIAAGTLDTSNQNMSVGGSWLNAGTFTAGTGTVTFIGTASGKTINPGASSFYKMIFNGSGGVWSPLTNAVTITNDLTMTAGTFDNSNGSANVTVNGNVIGTAGIFNLTASTFTQRVAAAKSFGTTSGSTNWTFSQLKFENSSAGDLTITTASGGTGQIIINSTYGNMTIGKATDTNKTTLDNETNDRILDMEWVSINARGGLLASSTAAFTVAGDWSVQGGTFTANSGTVNFDSTDMGNGQILRAGGQLFYNLTHSGTSQTSLNGALDVNGDFVNSGGTFDVVASDMTVAGSWTNSATFSKGTKTVTFDGTATGKTINPGASNFYNLIFNGSGGVWSPLTNTVTVTNDLTMTAGTFDTSNGTSDVIVNGTVAGTAGIINMTSVNTFTHRIATAKNFGTTSGSTNWTFYNLNFENSSAGDLTVTTPGTATGQIIIGGTLTVGNAGDSNTTTLDNETNDRIIDANGAVNITSKGVLSASSTASFTVAGNWTRTGTFTANSGTVTFDGTAAQTITGTNTWYNLTINNSYASPSDTYDVDPNAAETVTNTLTISDGQYTPFNRDTYKDVVISAAGIMKSDYGATLYVSGNWTNNGGSFSTVPASNVIFNGTGAQAINGTAASQTFYNLTVAKTAGQLLSVSGSTTTLATTFSFAETTGDFTAPATFNIGTYLTLTAGTFTAGTNTTIGNDWTNNGGTFTPGTNTVTFNGTGAQAINGTAASQTFYNLTVAKTAGQLLSVSGSTTTLAVFNFTETTGNFTAPATFNITGDLLLSAGTFTAGTNTNIGGNWTNNGGTFTTGSNTVTFNGTGAQAINGTAALQTFNNVVVAKTAGQLLSVSGSTTTLQANNFTETTGNFTAPATLTLGATLTLTAGTFTAGTTVTIGGDWTNNGGTFTPGTNTVNFSSNSTAINGTAASQTFYNLTVAKIAGQLLSVGGSTTSLAVTNFTETTGNFTAPATFDVAGTITLTAGTFTAGTSITIAGNWTKATAATFTPGTNTVTFDGTSSQDINGTSASQTFYNLIVAKTAGQLLAVSGSTATLAVTNFTETTGNFTAPATMNAAGNITLTAGTFTAGTNTNVTGNWSRAGTFTANSGTVTFNAAVAQTITGTNTWYNLIINNSYATPSDTYDVDPTAAQTVTNTLTISDGQYTPYTGDTYKDVVISAAGIMQPDITATITVSGNWTNNGGTFTANVGHVNFNGTGAQAINGTAATQTFYDLQVSKTAGTLLSIGGSTTALTTSLFSETTGDFTAPASLTISSTLTLTAGTFTAGTNISIGGDWTNNGGTFTPGTNTVTFNGTGAQAINGTAASQTFYNVTLAKTAGQLLSVSGSTTTLAVTNFTETTGNFTAPATFNITGNMTLTAGTFTAGANTNIAGNWSKAFAAIFTHSSGTVTFNGTAGQTLTGDTTFYNLTMDTNANGANQINFTNASTQTISHTWTLDGASGKVLTLRSTSTGNAWKFSIPADFTAGDYIDVKDSQNSATAYQITPGANTTNGGNNSPGWNFGMTFTVDNASLDFGNLLPGSVFTGYTETTVTINYLSGYSLSVSDGVAGSDSTLLHPDASTRITDYAGSITTPTSWSGTGLGICLYSGTGKDAKWGTGTTDSDSNNKYAGVPQASTIINTNSNTTISTDKDRIGYKLVVPNTQKTGTYTGQVTYTATALLP